MATLPPLATPDPTLDAIDAQIVARQHNEPRRGYLGMSAIGDDCERKLWYGFRFVARAVFDAVALRRFEDGHRGELLMAERLRTVPGLTLHTHDPSTGKQFGFSAVGGHFRGNIDGALLGLLQAPKTWHCWEHKVSETWPALLKLKNAGEKAALAAWTPTYYGQAQCYMHYGDFSRHYLTVDGPGGRTSVSVRTDYSKEAAERLEAKARRIITAAEPPARLSEDPAFWKCKGCTMAAPCHRGQLADVTCRTCVHATPELDGDGRWSCARLLKDLTFPEQQAACPDHLFIPALVPWGKAVDANEDENWIEYEAADGFRFRNAGQCARGPDAYGSKELRAVTLQVLRDPDIRRVRAGYLPDAVLVGGGAIDEQEKAA
jgi:hypothetical protein